METIAILSIVAGVSAVACSFLVISGLLVSKHLKRKNPGSIFSGKISPPELLVIGLNILALIAILTTRELYPDSSVGSLLQSPFGLLLALVILVLLGYLSGVLLALYRVLSSRTDNDTP